MTNSFLNIITDKIVSIYQPDKIILYGSQAYGTAKLDSDIDLVIIKDTTKRFIQRTAELLKIFRNSPERPSLDVLIYTPEEFKTIEKSSIFIKNEVVGKGRVIYERKG